ncbi:hypothetical protein N5W20_09420 [Candidatus Kirkpatrickella diaphorinae]|uniref:Uncharacterized protein n=1 Tax=Candidatus Kirkpatrickella diaphorinae TaxID=2984322 RepID=A0ABY6GJ43_9PROT|nr:hypothetical protein [Candidatus Kirkpatrickella diaphorinae]UYH51284.1 hypothetical protein N5W20_09420 [Candidatus Kirkpatrickella diaphorinae]
MIKLIAAINSLLLPSPPHYAHSDVLATPRVIADVMANRGATIAATVLTQQKRWHVVAQAIAKADPVLPRSDLRALMDHAPETAAPILRRAIRLRMVNDTSGGLALISIARYSPFNGAQVCREGNTAWKQSAMEKIRNLHDIKYTFQRLDCLQASEDEPVG